MCVFCLKEYTVPITKVQGHCTTLLSFSEMSVVFQPHWSISQP